MRTYGAGKICFLVVACICISFLGVVAAAKGIELSKAVGMTVGEVLKNFNLHVADKDYVIEEPPGIARGIHAYDEKNNLVYVYITRGDLPSDVFQSWKDKGGVPIEKFMDKKVIGIAIQHGKKWKTYGKVIAYYHINVN